MKRTDPFPAPAAKREKPLPPLPVLLGFAARARCCVAGDEGCRHAVAHRKAALLLYAADASRERIEAMLALCRERGVPTRALATDPGDWIGKPGRKWVALTDKDFAQKALMAPEGERMTRE